MKKSILISKIDLNTPRSHHSTSRSSHGKKRVKFNFDNDKQD
jgi:hypothetical protein